MTAPSRRQVLQGASAAAVAALGLNAGPAHALESRRAVSHGVPRPRQDIFVDPNHGDDAWSGDLPVSAGRDRGPFSTVQAALDRATAQARELQAAGSSRDTVRVWLRGGRHHLTEPVVVTPHGTDRHITVAPYRNEAAVITGGEAIDGWETTIINGVPAWATHLADVASGDWNFKQLFVNGERRMRPTRPKVGSYRLRGLGAGEGPNYMARVLVDSDAVEPFTNLTDVEINLFWNWRGYQAHLEAVGQPVGATTEITMDLRPINLDGNDPYILLNVFEDLSDPGEWYLDRPTGTLYYIPLPGESIESTEFIAPRTLQFVTLVGDPENDDYVENMTFTGLTFEHADYVFVGNHPELAKEPSRPQDRVILPDGRRVAGAPQAEMNLPGVIAMKGALNCTVSDCVIRHVGMYGIDLDFGCRDNVITGNHLHDLGGGGVIMSGGRLGTDIILPNGDLSTEDDPAYRHTGSNTVTDNHIHDAGLLFPSAIGIIARHSAGNLIAHNLIHDLRYTGISSGWNWGSYLMPPEPLPGGQLATISDHNSIVKNHVYNIGIAITENTHLDDMGGIYILGQQPHSVIDGNVVHDLPSPQSQGLYLDNSANGLAVRNNIFSGGTNALLMKGGHLITNNIFVNDNDSVIRYQIAPNYIVPPAPRAELVGNVLVSDGAAFLSQAESYQLSGPDGPLSSDLNVFFESSGGPILFGRADWRSTGAAGHGFVPVDFRYETGPAEASFVTQTTLGTLRNNFHNEVGMRIRIGGDDITVTALGRMIISGNTQTHRLRIYEVSTGAPVAETTLDAATGTPGEFAYADLSEPVTLVTGQEYFVVSKENTDGDQWHDGDTVLQSGAVADIISPAFNLSQGPTGLTLQDWQALGQDTESIVADPLFVDPDAGDYNLQPGSPAFDLGFEPIDTSDIGPRAA